MSRFVKQNHKINIQRFFDVLSVYHDWRRWSWKKERNSTLTQSEQWGNRKHIPFCLVTPESLRKKMQLNTHCLIVLISWTTANLNDGIVHSPSKCSHTDRDCVAKNGVLPTATSRTYPSVPLDIQTRSKHLTFSELVLSILCGNSVLNGTEVHTHSYVYEWTWIGVTKKLLSWNSRSFAKS